jgi:hypothetical protein
MSPKFDNKYGKYGKINSRPEVNMDLNVRIFIKLTKLKKICAKFNLHIYVKKYGFYYSDFHETPAQWHFLEIHTEFLADQSRSST